MELPKGVNLSVPDLSKFGPRAAPPIDFSHIKVTPGDSVMVCVSGRASITDIEHVRDLLLQWEPRVNWLVVSGIEHVAQVQQDPGGAGWNKEGFNPDPVEDKEPQGLDDAGYMDWMQGSDARGGLDHDGSS